MNRVVATGRTCHVQVACGCDDGFVYEPTFDARAVMIEVSHECPRCNGTGLVTRSTLVARTAPDTGQWPVVVSEVVL